MSKLGDMYKQIESLQNELVIEKLRELIADKTEVGKYDEFAFSIDELRTLISVLKNNGLEENSDYIAIGDDDEESGRTDPTDYLFVGLKKDNKMILMLCDYYRHSYDNDKKNKTMPAITADVRTVEDYISRLPSYTASEIIERISALNEFDLDSLRTDATIDQSTDELINEYEPKEEHSRGRNDYANIANSLSKEEWNDLLSETRTKDVYETIDQINDDIDHDNKQDRSNGGWDIDDQ